MNVQRWMARRETSWRQLGTRLKQSEKKGLTSLNSDQIRQMASLYRSASADLARARSHQVGPTVVKDLQGLTARGYSQIYQGSRRQDWKEIADSYRYGFPEVVQQSWAYITLATLLFFIGGAIGWWYAWQDESFMPLVLGSGEVCRRHGYLHHFRTVLSPSPPCFIAAIPCKSVPNSASPRPTILLGQLYC